MGINSNPRWPPEGVRYKIKGETKRDLSSKNRSMQNRTSLVDYARNDGKSKREKKRERKRLSQRRRRGDARGRREKAGFAVVFPVLGGLAIGRVDDELVDGF